MLEDLDIRAIGKRKKCVVQKRESRFILRLGNNARDCAVDRPSDSTSPKSITSSE
jgi:hypothetical protein